MKLRDLNVSTGVRQNILVHWLFKLLPAGWFQSGWSFAGTYGSADFINSW